MILGSTTLSGGSGSPVAGVTYRSNYNPNFAPEVPQFDVGYLVLSSASAQPQIKIAGTDETALWAPGSAVDISGWGDTSEFGGAPDTLQAATVNMIDDGTCAGDYPGEFDPNTMVCAGFQSGGVGHLRGRQRRPAGGAGAGRRVPRWSESRAGATDAPNRVTRASTPASRARR